MTQPAGPLYKWYWYFVYDKTNFYASLLLHVMNFDAFQWRFIDRSHLSGDDSKVYFRLPVRQKDLKKGLMQ